MLKVPQILAGIAVLSLCSVLIAQQPKVQEKETSILTETKGEFRPLTGEVKVTKGFPTKEFSSLENALGALKVKGYAEGGLAKLETLLSNPYREGEDFSNGKLDPLDGLVVIEEKEGKTKFTIASTDLSRFASFDQLLSVPNTQTLCHKVGSCRVCGGKIYCLIKKLFSSRFSNAIRR